MSFRLGRLGCLVTPPFGHEWEVVERREEARQNAIPTQPLDPTMTQFETYRLECRSCGATMWMTASDASVQFGRKT